MKIAIVGNRDESLGFSLAGVIPFIVNDEKEFISTLTDLFKDKEIGVIIIVDRYFELFSKRFEKRLQKSALPSIVFIPSIDKTHEQLNLKEFLANALGIKL